MSIKGQAYIAGVYEHPTRKADDKSLAQLHAEVAKGARCLGQPLLVTFAIDAEHGYVNPP